MSFVKDVFLPKYYNKLGIRKDTFLEIFTQLEKKSKKTYCIVETGVSKDDPSSIYLFDKFINFYDGKVFLFDINKVKLDVSNKTSIIFMDSIKGINSLVEHEIYEVDLFYLDSLETELDNDVESSERALNEFKSGIFYFKNSTLIFIDDTPKDMNNLPDLIREDSNIDMNSLKFPCGKGRSILDFIADKNEFEVIVHNYQVVLKYNVCEMVPKIFHRTWKTKTIDLSVFKPICVESWKKYNSDYTFILHDDVDNRNFIMNFYPWFLDTYDSYEKNIMRVDAVRYFYLLYYGGIYVDLDFECIKPLDPYIIKEVHLITNLKDWVSNAFMISAPQQIIFKKLIQNGVLKNKTNNNVLYATGPGMLSNYLLREHKEYLSKVALKPELFYPIKYNENFKAKYKELTDDVVCVHHFAASWV